MPMACPKCQTLFEQRLDCPKCGCRLVYPDKLPPTRPGWAGLSGPFQLGNWLNLAIGLLLAQGIYYGLGQLAAAVALGLLGPGTDAQRWSTGVEGLVLGHIFLAIGLVVGGLIAGAGRRWGMLYGAGLGVDYWAATSPPGWVPPPAPDLVTTPAPLPRRADDPFRITHEFEAAMPERLAAAKLRGFVDDLRGQVLASEPGLIRLRIGLPTGYTASPPSGSGIVNWFRGVARPSVAPGQEPVEVELGHQEDRVVLEARGFSARVAPGIPLPIAVRDMVAFLETLDVKGGSRGTLRLVSSGTGVWRAAGGRPLGSG